MANTLTELPKHWADELTHKVEPLVLKSVNALLASGKARIDECHNLRWENDKCVTTRTLIIDLGDTE